ncbi:uncharacterized protein LOC116344218 [Contarinia nasturtii]|uniref:uncharacterized protein LOC116344218 n=1 Tax=Contarinia nasturtii TaxID=265458 RepID=UPI0012D43051|nr:uncharacterized protein LOC116344218 [Contarinia nasturtii]
MAKLALIFLAVFCIAQLSFAARISRGSESETTTQSILNSWKSNIGQFQKDVSEYWDKTVTKENAAKLADTFTTNAKKLGEKTGELYENVKNKTTEFVSNISENKN